MHLGNLRNYCDHNAEFEMVQVCFITLEEFA